MYQVFEITERQQFEQLGTKEKFWFYDDKNKKLCKLGRDNTGENWSEKVACELAKLLGIPAAHYDLARWRGKQAVVSPSFVPATGHLVHGNELLAQVIKSYDEQQAFQLKQYQLSTVIRFWQVMERAKFIYLPMGYTLTDTMSIYDVVELFVAYLLFDCWIGNQDRHDQNWGLIRDYNDERKDTKLFLAPSFDHASSLACRMSIEEREGRLTTRDAGYSVQAFASKATTPFYSSGEGKPKRLKTLDCFESAVVMSKKQVAMKRWLQKLESITPEQVEKVLCQVPEEFGMNNVVVEFTMKYLESNKQSLLGLKL